MIGSALSRRVYAFAAPVDMRKGYDGLSAVVRESLGRDPLRGDLYLFVSRNRIRAKVLLWDGTGLCVYAKRLEQGRFTVALGHRRLAIIDLTHDGHQPMATSDQRYWIVFNGEIYNYRELRAGLEERGYAFHTRTDTEVILHLWEEHGVNALTMLDGMFAFALFDRV